MADKMAELWAKQGALLQQFALIGQAVGSPQRLKMLQLLCQSEKSVEALAQATEQSIASASAHLKVLKAACLVEASKRGRFVYYRLASPRVAEFWLTLRRLGEEQLPEVREVVREYFADGAEAVQMAPRELLAAVRQGKVLLLDVRPREEFIAGHLPQARSMPAEELAAHLETLPKRTPLLVYCRGPYCVTAIETVQRLRAYGRPAQRVALGVLEWRAAGLALELGPGAAKN